MGKEDDILTSVLNKRKIKLDMNEDRSFTKPIFYIFGDKGVGKTTTALTLPGTHGVISLDRKAKRIKDQIVKRDPSAADRIHIYDGVRYMSGNRDTLTEDSFITLKYIVKLLNEMPPVDWVTIDATEVLLTICEMTMRYVNRLDPFVGFKDWTLWKQRNAYVQEIHRLTYSRARVSPIYTGFSSTVEKLTERGIEETNEVPKWVDEIKSESDIVIKITQHLHGDTKTASQFATIVTSKLDTLLRTGDVIEISNYRPLLSVKQIEDALIQRPEVTLTSFNPSDQAIPASSSVNPSALTNPTVTGAKSEFNF
jgi:hypothetical protein